MYGQQASNPRNEITGDSISYINTRAIGFDADALGELKKSVRDMQEEAKEASRCEIRQEVEVLAKQVSSLLDNLSALEKRMAPVLTPAQDQQEGTAKKIRTTDLGNAIGQSNDLLMAALVRITQLARRVAL